MLHTVTQSVGVLGRQIDGGGGARDSPLLRWTTARDAGAACSTSTLDHDPWGKCLVRSSVAYNC